MRETIKRVSKSTVSIILSVMMIVSMMLVGMVATVNAATIPANTVIYFDASNATSAFNSVYLAVTANDNKDHTATNSNTNGANNYAPKKDKWYSMTNISGTNIWKATVSTESTVGKVSFFNTNESTYDQVWQCNCILAQTYDGTKNMFVVGSTYKSNDGRQSNCYGGTWETYLSECKITSTVKGQGTVTYKIGNTEIADLTKVAPNSVVTVTATPATGYSLKSITAGTTSLTSGGTFTITADTTVTTTFTLNNPTVELTATDNLNIGESCNVTANVEAELDYTEAYTIKKDGNTVNTSTYLNNGVFSTPCVATSAGTYEITYTATITDNGITAADSKSVTIIVAPSDEQSAYESMVDFLAKSENDPENLKGKTAETLNAYITAYEAAEALVGNYPTADGTACQNAYKNLTDRYDELLDKTSLPKPVLNVSTDTVDLSSANPSVTLTVSNADAYANANVTYKFYQNGTFLSENTEGSLTLDYTSVGTYTYNVEVIVGNDDNYHCPDNESETKTVEVNKFFDITKETVSNATVFVVDSSSNEITQAKQGDTVKVIVTPTNNNYKCTGITVTPTVNVTSNGNGTYSFTMPASNVTVKANVVEKTKYTVTASSNNTEWGTVSPETSTVYEGSTVTLTASTVGDNKFKSWNITGEHTLQSGSSLTSSSVTFIVNGNVTATATFEEDLGTLVENRYLIYSSTSDSKPTDWAKSGCAYVPIYKMSDGSWVAKLDAGDFDTGKRYYFALSSSTDYSGMYWQTEDGNASDIKVKSTDTSLATAGANNNYVNEHNKKYRFGNFTAQGTVSSIKITCSQALSDSYQYIVEPISNVPSDAIKVYTKDGCTREHEGISGTYTYGDTILTSGYLTDIDEDKDKAYSIFYVAPEGGIITIQTTLEASRHTANYYVFAYVINGETVLATSKGNGVYEATYNVPAESDDVEITPVYYNRNIEENGDYITFYVDASELGDRWGNIVACYSYYYKNGVSNAEGTYHGDGGYPGQPMLLNANGKYYTKLAKYYYDENGKKTSYKISGITLNNFFEYDKHADFLSGDQKKNHQTYDYDDFVEIANLEGIDTIQFDIKYRNKTTNQSTLSNGNSGATDTESITISTFNDSNHNKWDDFVDYDNNLVDIQGKPVTNKENKIYIVSTGNQNTSVGKWSTVWYVYNSSGTYITQGNPSDFIPRPNPADNTAAYNAMTPYSGYYTQICFESKMDAGSSIENKNSGHRVDGRWYYTDSTKYNAVVDTQVWFSDDDGANWALDESRTKGTATIDGEIKKTFEKRNVEATINAVQGNGYVFVEWGKVDDDGNNYKTISSSATDTFYVDTNYHLVAKFVKIDDGTLVLSHEKYVGPNAKGGKGFYYISAKHYNQNGNETVYDRTTGSIAIPVNRYDQSIEITLTTTMSGINTFIDWYEYANDMYQIIGPEDVNNFGKEGTVSYTFTVNVSDLYGEGVNELLVQNLNFYSDIAPVTADITLNYFYDNRFGESRKYVVKTTLSDEHIDKYGFKITDDIISANVPAIDDLHKDCVWTITDEYRTITGATADLKAVQPRKKFTVSISDDMGPSLGASVYLNDYIVLDSQGKLVGVSIVTDDYSFVVASTSNGQNQPFSYWLVENEDGREVARCYSKEFNLKIAGDYTITAIYGKTGDSLTISDATYTREQFTNENGSIVTDYLYADFILAYMPSSGDLLNGVNGTGYTTGLIVEFDREITLGVEDKEGGKLTESQMKKYDDNQILSTDELKDFIKSGNGTKVFDSDNDGDKNRALYNFKADNSKYNNKNRLDFYARFKNTAANRQYVYRAYYYVITPDNKVLLTEAVYFYLYDIGNSIPEIG